MSARGPWWARLLAALIDWWTGRQRQIGREEANEEQEAAGDALRKDYDAITSDDRTFDDALERLHERSASASRGRLPDAPATTRPSDRRP